MDLNTLLTVLAIVAIFVYIRYRKASRRSSPESLASALEQGAIVIDVRNADEYARGHYPGALNIPLEKLSDSLPALDARRDQPVIVYCQSGIRSAMARRLLQEAGYSNVLNAGTHGNLPAARN